MSEDDRSYFHQRAEAEAELAEQATHPEVAFVHSQLAAAYRDRVGSTDAMKHTESA